MSDAHDSRHSSSLWSRAAGGSAALVTFCIFPLLDDQTFYRSTRVNRQSYGWKHLYIVKETMTLRRLYGIPTVRRALSQMIAGESVELDVSGFPHVKCIHSDPVNTPWVISFFSQALVIDVSQLYHVFVNRGR